MDAEAFLADLEASPAALRELAAALRDGLVANVEVADITRVVFTGMGSSRFAALPVAAWLRARGIDAVAEYASLEQPHPAGPGTLVIGVSASGSTPETIAALAARAPGTRRVAVTNRPGPLANHAEHHVAMHAGEERGGVACRSFRASLAVLFAIAGRVAGAQSAPQVGRHLDVVAACDRAADAAEHLLEHRERWLAPTVEVLAEHPASFLIAPAERRSSAEQGALMLREGPRRQADAAETGDWCHVDVYLTRPLAYRGLLFTGSRFDRDALDWLERRRSRMVAVGGHHAELHASPAIAHAVRYRHDDDALTALLVEVLVPELIAASFWRRPHPG